MACRTCFPQSTLGVGIKGRSTAGHDVRERPLVYSRSEGKAQNGTMNYYPGAKGLTPEQQAFKHYGYHESPSGGADMTYNPLSSNVQTGMVQRRQQLAFDWGSFVGGMFVMGILVLLFGTETGREVSAATGKRAAKRIREGKRRY